METWSYARPHIKIENLNMISNTAFNKLLDAADEQIRFADLCRFYAYMLKRQGEVVEVKEIRDNIYEVLVTFKKTGEVNDIPIVWHDTQALILRPVGVK